MRLLMSRRRGVPSGPVSDATLERLYAFPRATWVRANFVSTIDGSATGGDGLTGSINTPADHRVFALNRRLADCIVVGAGTARAENYGPARRPLVIVSRRGRLPEGLRDKRSGRVVLATCAASRRRPAEDVWVCGEESVDLVAVLERCRADGMPRVLTEGGPQLFGGLMAAGLVDDLALTTTAAIVGGDHSRITAAPPMDVRADLRHLLEEDGTLLALWRVRR